MYVDDSSVCGGATSEPTVTLSGAADVNKLLLNTCRTKSQQQQQSNHINHIVTKTGK